MNESAAAEQTPAQRIEACVQALGITMTTKFIPWSQSRNKGEKQPSLNWLVTIWRDSSSPDRKRRPILTTDYGAGNGHCPSYKASVKRLGGTNSLMRSEAIKWECENGKAAWVMEGLNHISAAPGRKPLLPELHDVMHSLSIDADALDFSSFEEWAKDNGFDPDSRKAEATYRACLEIALKLRNALGEDGLRQLREACQDY